jgi:hypothetical protein
MEKFVLFITPQSVYLVMVRYGDIERQAFIGQAIKAWEVCNKTLHDWLAKDTWWPIST